MPDLTDYDITVAMLQFGGGFVRDLSSLWRRADDTNRSRLKAAFPELFEKYAELAKLKLAKAGQ